MIQTAYKTYHNGQARQRALRNKTTMLGKPSREAVWLVYPFSREAPLSEERREEQRALESLALLQSVLPHPRPPAPAQLQGTVTGRMPAARGVPTHVSLLTPVLAIHCPPPPPTWLPQHLLWQLEMKAEAPTYWAPRAPRCAGCFL